MIGFQYVERGNVLMNQNSSTAENLEFIANQIYPDVVILCDNETVKKKDKTMKKRIYFTIKRLFDIIASFFALIILSPIFLIIAIAIKVDSKGPAFYSQMRVGKNGKLFRVYKFRSMCQDADEKRAELQKFNERSGPAFKITNDPRITRVGKFIRTTCIDELPQCINILRGDMSVVGPRPPLPNEVIQYTDYQKKRLEAVPGLTCYWQVSKNKNDIEFDDWVALDVKYIQEQSLWVDLKLILKTVALVFRANGE